MSSSSPFGAATYAVLGGPGHADAWPADDIALTALEERITALEGGTGAVATASGLAALHLAIVTLLSPGAEILAAEDLPDATRVLLGDLLPRQGITTRFVSSPAPADWASALSPAVRLILAPTLGTVERRPLDIPGLGAWAHGCSLPLLVDGSETGPGMQRPLDLGADLLVLDAGPHLGGCGGMLVDGGRFDWLAGRGYPTLTSPSPTTGRIPALDEPLTAFLTLARQGLVGYGTRMSALEARRLLDTLPALSLVATARAARAGQVAAALAAHPAVTTVHYPGLAADGDPADRLLPGSAGAVIAFSLAGDGRLDEVFVTSLRLISRDSTPPRTGFLPASPRWPGIWRLAVGLEDAADLVDDLARALNRVAKALEARP